jgi:hypothetical protein
MAFSKEWMQGSATRLSIRWRTFRELHYIFPFPPACDLLPILCWTMWLMVASPVAAQFSMMMMGRSTEEGVEATMMMEAMREACSMISTTMMREVLRSIPIRFP